MLISLLSITSGIDNSDKSINQNKLEVPSTAAKQNVLGGNNTQQESLQFNNETYNSSDVKEINYAALQNRSKFFHSAIPSTSKQNNNAPSIAMDTSNTLENLSIISENVDPSGRKISDSRETKRDYGDKQPPFTYVALITKALQSAATGRMTLKEIYDYIKEEFPFYQNNLKKWQASIRYNLSHQDCFVKSKSIVVNGGYTRGKGGYWSLHPKSSNMFENSKYKRRAKKFNISDLESQPSSSTRGNVDNSALAGSRGTTTGAYNNQELIQYKRQRAQQRSLYQPYPSQNHGTTNASWNQPSSASANTSHHTGYNNIVPTAQSNGQLENPGYNNMMSSSYPHSIQSQTDSTIHH